MGLMNGELNSKGIYHGTARCDLCGKSESASMDGDTIKGKEAWRLVPFKYRAWIACSDKCQQELQAIGKREIERDKEGGTQSYQIRAQRRPSPIAGTFEAAGAGK